MSAALQEAIAAEHDVDSPTLFWIAAYLVQLEWGGHEEGGWWFEEASLVTAPDIYAELGTMPACRLSEAEAETVAAEMRTGLPALNEGRPPLSSTLSRGLYDVRVVRANTLPPCIPDCPPRYE